MNAYEISLAANDLKQRMSDRLLGSSTGRVVLWQQGTSNVVLHVETLQLRLLDGWMLASLDLETDQTAQQTLQFIFCMGAADNGDDLTASSTINAPNANAAILADAWGDTVRRVLWDAVLDGVEAAVTNVRKQAGTASLLLAGFHSSAQALVVSIVAGA